jgi:hypothetical protein
MRVGEDTRGADKSARSRERPLHGFATQKREPERRTVRELEFGVSVRADFAVQVDFFVLRGNPIHGLALLGDESNQNTCKNTTVRPKREERELRRRLRELEQRPGVAPTGE